MKTKIEVTHNEAQDVREFDTMKEAQEWADHVRKVVGVWGGEPTFTAVKITREAVTL